MFKVFHGIESGITVESAYFLVFSRYMETVNEAVNGIFYCEGFCQRLFFAGIVRIGSSDKVVVDTYACQWAESDV